jgi:hypothetical protein
MLGNLFNKKVVKTEEEIAKERQENLDKAIQSAAKLKKLIIDKDSGWIEFIGLIDDYINKAAKRKAITALDVANEETIQQLKYLDHEIYILNWMKQMPQQFITNLDDELAKQKESEGE